ncbi:hypothetical protein Q5P01_004216 [Channa striata]|uniref:SMC hinge domain-containing protein n=1 Tax=Channa striata TaxID=64152 RepID=A0AA88NNT5_CHASR|nr:hypothetical protein Q5P01_004216 [Channa striata]
MSHSGGASRSSRPSSGEGSSRKQVRVYDCRLGHNLSHEKVLETSGLDFNGFLQALREQFAIHSHEIFVVATTDRTVLDFDRFENLPGDSTLYLLQSKDQALPVATEEQITFMPHYDTLIRSGMYEYYASEGQHSLAYALAELIDNSLSATAKNTATRTIEIRMVFDETIGKPAVIVLDNGRGMTPKQLNNWAVYRMSKFMRGDLKHASSQEAYVRPDPVPRSLNSDISYFGVGGKQAVFYIGTSVRMISKPEGSPDVHELVLSKEEFEKKEKNKEDIYCGTIRNRKPGDTSLVNRAKERFLLDLIAEETGKDSFTAVVITDVVPDHIHYLKESFKEWTRQLAHIYHYYIHGVNGNDMKKKSEISEVKIDIQITLREKPPRCPRVINLREIDDDMQTLYINASAATFEFKAFTTPDRPDSGTVEGILRYHPFLYDRETYPKEPSTVQAPGGDDDDDDDSYINESGVLHQARGKRPIFECFWNGRLIPYTKVSEFDWCTCKNNAEAEFYNRVSGVLFTDDRFQVSTNKLTFMDLELKLKQNDTIFTRVVDGQKSLKRSDILKEFTEWLKKCHEYLDKQVKFLGFKETITRTDVTVKKMQHPWATFSSIEWDGKKYKADQLVKSKKTQPIHYGKVNRFLLHGPYKEDVFATGGFVEITLEPKALHNKTKIIPICKIDKTATDEAINMYISNDAARLPDKLKLDWPDGNPWSQNDVHPAGAPLGPLKIEILNKKGESISRMPAGHQAPVTKLSIRLKVVLHGAAGPKKDEVVVNCVAQHGAKWGFWFKKIEKLIKLGNYTLFLNAVISDTHETAFAGRGLPSYELKFTLKEGSAEGFVMEAPSSPLRVGVPFNIPLQMKDRYDHSTAPPPDLKPVLECSGLVLSYETVDSSGTTFTIRNVIARGKVLNFPQSKTYDLNVTLPGLKKATKTLKISLLPGNPHSLHVMPDDSLITVENRNSVKFDVEIHDECGNITAHPKQIVRCQIPGHPLVFSDCSSTGSGQLETKPINVKVVKGEPQKLKVHFNIPNQKNIATVLRELNVMPSTKVSVMELCSQDDRNLVLRNNEKIEWLAGGLLENLFYKLYDEGGREVPLTAEIASMIKVNWTVDLKVEDLSVSVSFTIVPRPDEPTRLKVTLPQTTVKLGETLSETINLELVDHFVWKKSSNSVGVAGVCFLGGTPGPREMCFTYGTYVEQVIIKVTAGDPAKLKLISGPSQPLQVVNDHNIRTPFLVQLFDEWDNPSSDQRVVVELKSSLPSLKITTAIASRPVDSEGKASFTVTRVSGPKGNYHLVFRGSFNNKPISGPSVNLIVLPDPNKPVELTVEYDNTANFPAGGSFPVFFVTVLSDGGSPMTTFNPAAVSMWLWEGVASEKTPSETAIELKCSKPMQNERKDCFHFRDKEIPKQSGKYTLQFSLRNDTIQLYSKQIIITVVANQPVKLGPDAQPPLPVVSNTKDINNRKLVENLTLRIMDSYGNPAGQDLDGRVVISMKNSRADVNKILPQFEGGVSRHCIKFEEGKIFLPRLAIMENSPGENGSEYTLVFTPEVSMVPSPLAPFELIFHFYNDTESQRKTVGLSKRRDELMSKLPVYKGMFSDYNDLLSLLTDRKLDADRKLAELKDVLIQRNIAIPQTFSIANIDKLLQEKTAESDRILKMRRRVCSIRDNFSGQPDVLGVVGHLAYVAEDDAARVISWSISGDMDCVITKTTDAALKIYNDTQGRQQVMPLDGIFVSQANRPLPHIRNGLNLFDPPGNPVFARDLLIFPHDQDSCKIAFKNILGETILIDDLASGTSYRKAVVQNQIPCPTILTRQGDRISGKGKFGGSQNKAPPMARLQVFGAPLPNHYHVLKQQIELLCQCRSALEKCEQAKNDYENHLSSLTSTEMQKKRQEMQAIENELEMIKTQLDSLPVRPEKRAGGDAGGPSGIVAKRPRQ